jgi:hypothetical protein
LPLKLVLPVTSTKCSRCWKRSSCFLSRTSLVVEPSVTSGLLFLSVPSHLCNPILSQERYPPSLPPCYTNLHSQFSISLFAESFSELQITPYFRSIRFDICLLSSVTIPVLHCTSEGIHRQEFGAKM